MKFYRVSRHRFGVLKRSNNFSIYFFSLSLNTRFNAPYPKTVWRKSHKSCAAFIIRRSAESRNHRSLWNRSAARKFLNIPGGDSATKTYRGDESARSDGRTAVFSSGQKVSRGKLGNCRGSVEEGKSLEERSLSRTKQRRRTAFEETKEQLIYNETVAPFSHPSPSLPP